MTQTSAIAETSPPAMNLFERYLTLWVALCIVAGVALGQAIPAVFRAIGGATVAQVNLPVAVLVWLMVIPMLLKIDLAALGQVREQWRGIAVTVGVNWLVKPFSMALLGWLFIAHLFRPFLRRIRSTPISRAYPARGGALHGDGVRVVESRRWRAAFHALASRAQRFDHDRRLRADRRAASRPVVHHRALEHAAVVGRPLHRPASHRRAALAARAAGAGGKAALEKTLRALGPLSLLALLATLVLLFGLQARRSCASRSLSR